MIPFFSDTTPCVIGYSHPDIASKHGGLILKRQNILTFRAFNVWLPHCLEMSGTDYPGTQRHIPEGRNPELYRCRNLRTQWHYLPKHTIITTWATEKDSGSAGRTEMHCDFFQENTKFSLQV